MEGYNTADIKSYDKFLISGITVFLIMSVNQFYQHIIELNVNGSNETSRVVVTNCNCSGC